MKQKLQMGFPFVTSVPFWVGSEGALLLAVRSKWLCSPASTLLRGAILTKLTILNLEGCEFSSHVIAEGVVGDPQLPRGYLWVGEIVDFFVGDNWQAIAALQLTVWVASPDKA